MKMYPVDLKVREFWKAFPLRISGGSKCRHCKEDTVLVQSMDGGFVTRNCPSCNNPEKLPKSVFLALNLWVACPNCKDRMKPATLPDKNYGYICDGCDVGVTLHDLLPRWSDL